MFGRKEQRGGVESGKCFGQRDVSRPQLGPNNWSGRNSTGMTKADGNRGITEQQEQEDGPRELKGKEEEALSGAGTTSLLTFARLRKRRSRTSRDTVLTVVLNVMGFWLRALLL